jgi:SAM-dependent methyltransferase
MSYSALRSLVPHWLKRQVFFFEEEIVRQLAQFAASLPLGSLVLDAGAGEGQYRSMFPRQRYIGLDLGIGDEHWNYRGLDMIGDLLQVPLRDGCVDAIISIVTLEHVRDPRRAVMEMARVAKPGCRLLLAAPLEWEEHQAPHDYFRFTRHALRMLLEENGWQIQRLEAGGGFFRLLSRRMMNGLQFFPAPLPWILAIPLVPLALFVGVLDTLDQKKNYTLGYFVEAIRQA